MSYQLDPTAFINGIFDAIAQRAPILRGMLDRVRNLVDATIADLPKFLADHGIVSLTEDNLKEAVDYVFAWIEGTLAGHLLVVELLDVANREIDSFGVPALAAWLRSLGLLTA